jgi:regulator of sirC expression with transglutaminase-like and TPR domain
MPPNEFTEEAQESAGVVYERLNQPEKAKAEYKAFISMYPDSTRLARVRQHLIALTFTSSAHKHMITRLTMLRYF